MSIQSRATKPVRECCSGSNALSLSLFWLLPSTSAWSSALSLNLFCVLPVALRKVIPEPVKRPAGWVSAAFPADSVNPEAQMCSAGYQVTS